MKVDEKHPVLRSIFDYNHDDSITFNRRSLHQRNLIHSLSCPYVHVNRECFPFSICANRSLFIDFGNEWICHRILICYFWIRQKKFLIFTLNASYQQANIVIFNLVQYVREQHISHSSMIYECVMAESKKRIRTSLDLIS